MGIIFLSPWVALSVLDFCLKIIFLLCTEVPFYPVFFLSLQSYLTHYQRRLMGTYSWVYDRVMVSQCTLIIIKLVVLEFGRRDTTREVVESPNITKRLTYLTHISSQHCYGVINSHYCFPFCRWGVFFTMLHKPVTQVLIYLVIEHSKLQGLVMDGCIRLKVNRTKNTDKAMCCDVLSAGLGLLLLSAKKNVSVWLHRELWPPNVLALESAP